MASWEGGEETAQRRSDGEGATPRADDVNWAQRRDLARASQACGVEMQLVADLLLLSGEARPVYFDDDPGCRSDTGCSSSFERCRDAVVARSKGLMILLHELQASLNLGRFAETARLATETGSSAVALVECAAQAAYLVAVGAPGSRPACPSSVADPYRMARSRHRIERCCARLSSLASDPPEEQLTAQQLLDLSKDVHAQLLVLSEACAGLGCDPTAREQLKLAVHGAGACGAALLACVRALRAEPGARSQERCALFAAPLEHSVRALVALASESRFRGPSAELSATGRAARSGILGGAMSVAAACVTVARWLRDAAVTVDPRRSAEVNDRLREAAAAAADGCELLLRALREKGSPRLLPPEEARRRDGEVQDDGSAVQVTCEGKPEDVDEESEGDGHADGRGRTGS
uniref:talin rod domain-containing protein 1-like n=1 Tax=Myxine glutinosa TaxID=7769 RepID=UPI00358E08D3